MIINNSWYLAAWANEVTIKPLARKICNKPIVLYRTLGGQANALLDSCCHRGAPLSLGTVVENGIRCNYHGLVFGCGGECVEIPNQEKIPEKSRVDKFPLVEKDQMLWIWIGSAEKVDDSLIPDYPFHNDTKNWPHYHDMVPIKSSYLMLIDNLLDLTHLSYVHPDSVGGSAPGIHMEAQNDLMNTENGVILNRFMQNAPPPKTYNNCVELPERIDRWQEFEFIAPSSVIQYSGGVPAGEDRKTVGAPRFDMRLFHSYTPETDTTCFYFWSAANGHDTNNPAATEKIYKEIQVALDEDKIMVEAQQERVTELGSDWLVDNVADRPRVSARRAIKRLNDRQNPQI